MAEPKIKRGRLVADVREVPVRRHLKRVKSEQPKQQRRPRLEDIYDEEVVDVAEDVDEQDDET